MPDKWTPINLPAAQQLTMATSSPGAVSPLATTALPANLHRMPGAVSYFVSGYVAPLPLAQGVTAGGEMAVVRTEGEVAKAYNYVFATSSDGQVCFNGPYKHFPDHHFPASSSISIEKLFGHHAFSKA